MFHIFTYGSTTFDEWLEASNQLYYAQHLELGGRHQDYIPFKASDINAQPQDQFLLYIDDEAGICGSAAVVALPYDLEIESQFVPQGTWMLRNVFFHLRQGHPLQYQSDKFLRVVDQFHLGLFEHLWQLAQRAGHQSILSLQNDWEVHEDLKYFGGFTLSSEIIEQADNLLIDMAIMPMTAQTYRVYQQKVKQHQRYYKDQHRAVMLPKVPSSTLMRPV